MKGLNKSLHYLIPILFLNFIILTNLKHYIKENHFI